MKKSSPVLRPSHLLRSTGLVSGMTLLSRILGFIRDVVFASIFGAGNHFDAFIIAFKLPNFFRRLFGEGAFAQAFVPILSELQTQQPPETTQAFIHRTAGTLITALLLIILTVELLAPIVIILFAPGFAEDSVRYHLALHMIRITFPYLLLISLVSFIGSILNTYGRFSIPALTPLLLNMILIIVAWYWAPHTVNPIITLAWGVLLGGLIQLAFQWPFLKKTGFSIMPQWGWQDRTVRRVMKSMVPALFGVSVAQISLLIDNMFASFLPAGSISWLYYSDRLTYLPLGVVGVAIATVILPKLSQDHSRQSPTQYSHTLDWALKIVIILGMPAAVGLFILAGPLLSTLIQHGQFTVTDVMMARKSLMAYAVGLPGFMLVKVLASAFYSKQNIRTPVRVAAIAVLLNILLNFTLIHALAHAGLALSTSLASLFNAGVLLLLLIKNKIYQSKTHWWRLLWQVTVAIGCMTLFILCFQPSVNTYSHWTTLKRIIHLTSTIAGSLLFYFIGLWLMGFRIKHLQVAYETDPRTQ